MSDHTSIREFIYDWFGRFDRLEPVEAFLPNLHKDVVWEMADADENLRGHARFRAWYEGILATFERPTEHALSGIEITDDTVQFEVNLRAKLKDGSNVDVTARESWRYQTDADGTVILTHYTAEI